MGWDWGKGGVCISSNFLDLSNGKAEVHEGPAGSRGIAILSVLDEVGGQRHAPAALPPGNSRYPLCRRLCGTQGRSGRVRKISPSPHTGIRFPDRPARSESLYRLSYIKYWLKPILLLFLIWLLRTSQFLIWSILPPPHPTQISLAKLRLCRQAPSTGSQSESDEPERSTPSYVQIHWPNRHPIKLSLAKACKIMMRSQHHQAV